MKLVDDNKATKGELEWIDILNYTVDYGDLTCSENKMHPEEYVLVQLLNNWKTTSEKYNISNFLGDGSLIGAVRNAHFIPYDTDIDIMVDEKFYEAIARIDNKRNFRENPNDVRFHLVVQPSFRDRYQNKIKLRQNCLGEVKILLAVSLKYQIISF